MTQTRFYDYKFPLNSDQWNGGLKTIVEPGVYDGLDVITAGTGLTLSITSGTAMIPSGTTASTRLLKVTESATVLNGGSNNLTLPLQNVHYLIIVRHPIPTTAATVAFYTWIVPGDFNDLTDLKLADVTATASPITNGMITNVTKKHPLGSGGGSGTAGVTSIQNQSGTITITSASGTVNVTTPVPGTINLEAVPSSSGTTIGFQNSGTNLGSVTAINFTGAGKTMTISGTTGTVTIPGGGGGSGTVNQISGLPETVVNPSLIIMDNTSFEVTGSGTTTASISPKFSGTGGDFGTAGSLARSNHTHTFSPTGEGYGQYYFIQLSPNASFTLPLSNPPATQTITIGSGVSGATLDDTSLVTGAETLEDHYFSPQNKWMGYIPSGTAITNVVWEGLATDMTHPAGVTATLNFSGWTFDGSKKIYAISYLNFFTLSNSYSTSTGWTEVLRINNQQVDGNSYISDTGLTSIKVSAFFRGSTGSTYEAVFPVCPTLLIFIR